MNRQAVFRATFAQHGQHTTSVRFHFEDHHRIIRVPNQVGTGTHARQNVAVKPLVQNIVEIHVCQHGRNDSPLRTATVRVTHIARIHHTRIQPFADQA